MATVTINKSYYMTSDNVTRGEYNIPPG